jgi:hypothetical protein
MAFPGIDLPDDYTVQVLEEEVLKPEDYAKIAEIGWGRFMKEDYIFRLMDMTPEGFAKGLADMAPLFFQAIEMWRKRGVVTLYPLNPFILHPFFRFSLGRSMVKFTEDLYCRPEMVEKALKTMTREFIQTTVNGCKMFGNQITLIVEERAGCFFYPPKIFGRRVVRVPSGRRRSSPLWKTAVQGQHPISATMSTSSEQSAARVSCLPPRTSRGSLTSG